MKTIGHVKSLRKWPVDVLNSILQNEAWPTVQCYA